LIDGPPAPQPIDNVRFRTPKDFRDYAVPDELLDDNRSWSWKTI
jgi:hypothetical protein